MSLISECIFDMGGNSKTPTYKSHTRCELNLGGHNELRVCVMPHNYVVFTTHKSSQSSQSPVHLFLKTEVRK